MKTRHTLDSVRIERRAIPAHGSIVLDLPFPPATGETDRDGVASHAHETWRMDAHEAIVAQRPRCANGPVEISVTLEDRRDFLAFDNLTANIIQVLVRNQIISSPRSSIVRRLTLQFGKSAGARVEISPVAIPRAA